MISAVLGAMAASGDAKATRRDQAPRDQASAASSARAATARPATAPRSSSRNHAVRTIQANGQGRYLRLVADPGRWHAAGASRRGRATVSSGSGGISCVPYARAVTGIQVSGNGGDWWGNAAGVYDRGQRPEPGAVMAFRAKRGMSHGHVAVVRELVNAREVLIDHANWGGPGIRRGTVMQNVSVVDVSDRNDWSAVKVQVGHSAEAFGQTYPTYGFIYNRPDDAVNTGTAYAGMPMRRSSPRYEQVADMPEASTGRGYSLQGMAPLSSARAAETRRR
ncbi:MAG: hypothetical protein JWP04_1487 [Belnapia sp.]|nr:hypothetical protein [Belnapia sp.]